MENRREKTQREQGKESKGEKKLVLKKRKNEIGRENEKERGRPFVGTKGKD